jgi:hypothetical protein
MECLPRIVCNTYYAEQITEILMRYSLVLAIAAVCLPSTVALAQAGVDTHPPIYFELPGMNDVAVTKNLVYKTITAGVRPRRSLALDVYSPRDRAANPAPIVIFVHGGLTLDSPGDARDW